MPQRTLRFKIHQDGRVEETVEGIIGDSCLLLTKKLEAQLGTVETRKPTPEAFMREKLQTQSLPLEIS